MSSGDVHLKRILDVPGRITQEGLSSSNAKLIDPPAVAMALAGQGKTRGTVAITLASLTTNQSVALIKPSPDRLDTEYLFHALAFRYDELRSRSSGEGRAGLSKGLIEQIPLPLPPPEEQTAIADILATVDRAIAQSEALIAKQRRIKAGLLHDLLTRGIDAQGNLRHPSTHRFKASPVGPVPEEWEVVRVRDVCDFASGGTPARTKAEYWNGTIPWVKTAEIDYNFIKETEEYITELGLQSSSAKVFPKGTLLMAIYGEGVTRGRVAILGIDAATNQACLAFFPNPILRTDFLFHWFMASYSRLRDLSHDGSQKNLSATLLGDTHIPIPDWNEQAVICSALQSLAEVQLGEQTYLSKLQRLKTGLMQDLLSGRVSVAGLLAGQ